MAKESWGQQILRPDLGIGVENTALEEVCHQQSKALIEHFAVTSTVKLAGLTD